MKIKAFGRNIKIRVGYTDKILLKIGLDYNEDAVLQTGTHDEITEDKITVKRLSIAECRYFIHPMYYCTTTYDFVFLSIRTPLV